MNGVILGAHSPLGASGMKRWEACAFSIFAALGAKPEDEDESEFASEGTAAHTVIEACLTEGIEAWMLLGARPRYVTPTGIGYVAEDKSLRPNVPVIEITKDMTDAADEWLSLIRKTHPDRNQGNSWIERKFHCPTIHRLFYGTSDFIFLDEATKTLHVWDYKHGQGVIVEAVDNPQGLYYAAGAVETLGLWNTVDTVVIHIVQPRAAHWQGPHRTWTVATEWLDDWVSGKLVPAMERAEATMKPGPDGAYEVPDPVPGEHCQFCPVRHKKCPALTGRLEQLEGYLVRYEKEGIEGFTPEERSRMWDLFDRIKTMNTANNKAIGDLFAAGTKVPGLKQVTGKADRVWPSEVKVGEVTIPFIDLAKREFGADALTVPELKSPAQIDKLPKGKTFTARHAFKPEGRLNVVRDTDNRPEVSRNTKSLFKPVAKK